MARRIDPWARLGMNAMWLGWEAQTVIGLRMLKLAAGGSAAAAEAERMVTEKVGAALVAQNHLIAAAMIGGTHHGPGRALAHYRKKVRANRRRLLKG